MKLSNLSVIPANIMLTFECSLKCPSLNQSSAPLLSIVSKNFVSLSSSPCFIITLGLDPSCSQTHHSQIHDDNDNIL